MNCVKTKILPVLLIAVTSAVLSGCSSPRTTSAPAPESVTDMAIIRVQRATLPDWIEASGTVEASHTSPLASETMGRVLEVAVREGDRVRRGQVLVLLADTEERAGLERAVRGEDAARQGVRASEADHALAETTQGRYEALYQKKSVSAQEFDEVRARMEAATARLEASKAELSGAAAATLQARERLAHMRIVAPFDGLVTSRAVDPGVLALPGVPLLTVEESGPVRLEVNVGEGEIRHVAVGARASVLIDGLDGAQMQGTVAQVVPVSDPRSRSVLVKVDLPQDSRLRTGTFGRARFVRGERTSLTVPAAALVDRGSLQGVYVLSEDGIAGLRYVTLGQRTGEAVEVLSGLAEGERLVASPGSRPLAGKRIEER